MTHWFLWASQQNLNCRMFTVFCKKLESGHKSLLVCTEVTLFEVLEWCFSIIMMCFNFLISVQILLVFSVDKLLPEICHIAITEFRKWQEQKGLSTFP